MNCTQGGRKEEQFSKRKKKRKTISPVRYEKGGAIYSDGSIGGKKRRRRKN